MGGRPRTMPGRTRTIGAIVQSLCAGDRGQMHRRNAKREGRHVANAHVRLELWRLEEVPDGLAWVAVVLQAWCGRRQIDGGTDIGGCRGAAVGLARVVAKQAGGATQPSRGSQVDIYPCCCLRELAPTHPEGGDRQSQGDQGKTRLSEASASRQRRSRSHTIGGSPLLLRGAVAAEGGQRSSILCSRAPFWAGGGSTSLSAVGSNPSQGYLGWRRDIADSSKAQAQAPEAEASTRACVVRLGHERQGRSDCAATTRQQQHRIAAAAYSCSRIAATHLSETTWNWRSSCKLRAPRASVCSRKRVMSGVGATSKTSVSVSNAYLHHKDGGDDDDDACLGTGVACVDRRTTTTTTTSILGRRTGAGSMPSDDDKRGYSVDQRLPLWRA
jgi:hypothetical protein